MVYHLPHLIMASLDQKYIVIIYIVSKLPYTNHKLKPYSGSLAQREKLLRRLIVNVRVPERIFYCNIKHLNDL